MARRFFDITSAINAVIRHSDTHAFEFLFDIFYDKLLRVGLYYLEREALAEDAISEVFFKLWSGRKKLHKVENIENYLFTMTKNQCLTVLRSSHSKLVFDAGHESKSQQIVLDNPETSLISKEFIHYYNTKVNELPPKCKLVYLMVKEDGLRYKEVANLLGISVKTVENQMTKAMAHVRKCLADYNDLHQADDISGNL